MGGPAAELAAGPAATSGHVTVTKVRRAAKLGTEPASGLVAESATSPRDFVLASTLAYFGMVTKTGCAANLTGLAAKTHGRNNNWSGLRQHYPSVHL